MATVRNPDTVRSDQDPKQIVLRGQRQQIIGLLLIISALVLFMAPWIAGYPETAKDAHRNELGVGLIVLFIGAAGGSEASGCAYQQGGVPPKCAGSPLLRG